MLVHSFQLVADLVLVYLVVAELAETLVLVYLLAVADVAEALALANVAEADVASSADAVLVAVVHDVVATN